MIRVIVVSTPNGNQEEVLFTEDVESSAEDLFTLGDMTVNIDETIEELPGGFPMDYILRREQF